MMNTFGWSVVMALTLCQFFDEYFMKLWIEPKKLDLKTQSSYRETLAHWLDITGDPGLTAITDLTCANFVTTLSNRKGKLGPKMSTQSVTKHCRQLVTMLKLAGPRSQSSQNGQKLIVELPFVQFPVCEKKPPKKSWSLDEVRRLYSAAKGMTKPEVDGVDPADWWATFVVIGYYVGLRVHAMTHITYDMLDGDWINVSEEISKGGRGARKYLHQDAVEHINRIRTPGRAEILHFPKWSTRKRYAYDYLYELQDRAGLPENRQHGFHGFRRVHSTVIRGLSLISDRNLTAAQQSCGHASRDITIGHYVDPDVQEQIMVDAISRMPRICGPAVAPRAEPVAKAEKVEVRTDAWSVWKERFGSGNTVS